MHMARRVAAWVAWAVWTCKPAGASGPPRALTGYGLKRAGFGPLFFLVVRPAWARPWRWKSSFSQIIEIEAKRNCLKVTERGKGARSELLIFGH